MSDIKIDGVTEIFLDAFSDERGEIYTFWKKNDFVNNFDFNHDKFTMSYKNVFRGIHGDFESTKYFTCVFGEVFYVLVDNRINSETYLQVDCVKLSQEKKNAFIIPPGVGTGVLTLSDISITSYKLFYPNNYPDADKQFSIKWNDISVDWPVKNMILSKRDK